MCLYFIIEPYVYRNTQFGDGEYPIVYSNVSCGGWEDDITHCKRNDFKDTICSRQHVAGVLCGYGMFISMQEL